MVHGHSQHYSLDVVIPMFNEVPRLQSCLEQIAILNQLCPIQNVYFVDDGSSDDSVAYLKELDIPEWIHVLVRPHLGKGGAIRYGLEQSTAAYVLISDVDWSVNPSWIPRLLTSQGELIIAVREGHGARRIGEPVWRHLLGRVFNRYVQWMAMAGHADTQCGCKILSRKAVKTLLPHLKTNGWAFDVELLAQAHIWGILVSEVPVAWLYDADSRVRPLRDGIQMAIEVIRIRRSLKRATDPNQDLYPQKTVHSR